MGDEMIDTNKLFASVIRINKQYNTTSPYTCQKLDSEFGGWLGDLLTIHSQPLIHQNTAGYGYIQAFGLAKQR